MVTSTQNKKLGYFAANIESLDSRKKLDASQKAKLVENFDKSMVSSINTKLLALDTIDKQTNN